MNKEIARVKCLLILLKHSQQSRAIKFSNTAQDPVADDVSKSRRQNFFLREFWCWLGCTFPPAML